MRRFIYQFGCCLLAVTLLTNQPILAAAASDAKPKAAENPNATDKAESTEPPKPAEEAEQTEKTKPTETPEKPPASKPDTHTVKAELLKIEVSLDGVFEAQKMTEVSLETKAWSTLSVVSAVEHGTQVKKGDLLVSLDREKIDQAISDLRAEHQASDLSIKLAEQQLRTLEKSTPMDRVAGERADKEAREDLDYYFKVRRPMMLKSAEASLKYAQESYEFQEEELRQLEKMYAADDLTEETEGIILKRARNALAREKFYLEQSKIYHDRTVNVLIPRDDVTMKESAKRLEMLWNDTQAALPVNLKQRQLAMDKLKLLRSRSEEKLQKLLVDRAAMTVKAPAAGVVYYGKCTRGKFTGSTSTTLRRGSSLMPKQVFMTLVQTRPMFIRASTTEKQLHQVRAGIEGTAVPTGFPDIKLTAIVDRVATIPTSSGSFDSRITVALGNQAEPLMPGMTCKVKLISYENKSALTVPTSYLKTDEENEEKHYVYLLGKKDKAKKRYVIVGKRTSGKVEILKGLSEGDKVLAEEPKDEKPSTEKKKPVKEKAEKKPAKETKESSQKKGDSPKKDKDNAKKK